MLDRLVQAERARLGFDDDDAGMQGRAISFPEPEPWPEPVDGAALLDEIAATLKRYVVMGEQARHSAALWVVHTYLLDCFHDLAAAGGSLADEAMRQDDVARRAWHAWS